MRSGRHRDLEQDRRVIRWPTSVGRFRAGKTQLSKIELLYEDIDRSDRIALGNPSSSRSGNNTLCYESAQRVKLTSGPASMHKKQAPSRLVWLNAGLCAWCWQGIGDLGVLDNHVTIREQSCKERLQFDLGQRHLECCVHRVLQRGDATGSS